MQHGERRRQGLFTSATDAPLPLSICLGHHCVCLQARFRLPFPFLFLATACHCLQPTVTCTCITLHGRGNHNNGLRQQTARPHGRPRISLGQEHTLNLWNKAILLSLSLSVFLDVFFQHIWSISLKAGEGSPQHLNEETWEMAWTR